MEEHTDDARKQYAKNSTMQAAVNRGAVPHLKAAGRAVARNGTELRVADFGCSVGNNSAKELQVLIDSIRSEQGGSQTSISVYSADVPSNNWNALFRNVAAGYGSAENVFCFAAAGSFYEQMFPDNFLDVGYAAICLHWLSRPVPSEHLFPTRDPVAAETAAKVAADDWLRFLKLWRRQSRAGSHLVCTIPSPFPKTPDAEWWTSVHSAWVSMAEDGLLSKEDVQKINVPVYHRTAEELLEPFTADPEISEALEVLALEDASALSPAWKALYDSGDLDGLARSISGMARTALSSSFRKALEHLGDAEGLIDEWASRATQGIRAALKSAESVEGVGTFPSFVLSVHKKK